MDPPCPPHRTFAARAAYFGERMCAFCDHCNPADAKFCNDCASPLHVKPCNQCHAVIDQAATNCWNCGAACPVLFDTSEATPVLSSADPAPAAATPDGVAVTATVTQPLFATSPLRAYWRYFRPGQVLLAAIATILIAGVYTTYYINAVTPDVMKIASEPIGAREHNEPATMPTFPVTMEPKLVEPETTAALPAPIPATSPEAPKRASARQRPVTVPATKRASAPQRSAPERRTPVGATPMGTQSPAPAPIGVPVAGTRKTLQSDRWQAMHASLARCSGDLIARIVCDQRVRRHFCEGHWDKAECASGFANDHGQ